MTSAESVRRGPGLLVSVRSAAEAEAALVGGAAIVDVKEPRHGSLGRADDDTIRQVVRAVGGRRPVSAALGEWATAPSEFPANGLGYLKWGLAHCGSRPGWVRELAATVGHLRRANGKVRAVAVAYADWRRAGAPEPETVARFAREHDCGAFLLDTWRKDGTTLLDWVKIEEAACLVNSCQECGVPVALAGSLGVEQIRTLLPLEPDWFAVRGAACRAERRAGSVEAGRVRRLVTLLAEPCRAARHAG
jgi:(5-formylfuran-3-yl)methyl phosphate synthase